MLRFRAWKLVRMICLSFREKLFTITNANNIKYKDLSITYTPTRIRLFDKVRVFYKKQEIWLPLVLRLVLRRHVRKYLINQTLERTFGL